MLNKDATKEQLLREIDQLKSKISEFEKSALLGKQLESDLKRNQNRYEGIFQNTLCCMVVFKQVDDGDDFVIVEYNPTAEKTDNISKEEVIGKKVTEVFPGVKDFGLFEVFQDVWKTGNPQHFPVSAYKDNRIQGYRENYVYKLPSGEIVAVYKDVTTQKQSQEALANSELKFRLLANNTYDWEYWVDPDGKYVFISDSCEEISGHSAAEFYENHELFYNIVHPDYTEMVKTHYHSEEEKETPMAQMEFPIINRNGDLRWIEHNCTPVFDEHGIFMGRRGHNRDITESKQVKRALQESEEKLRAILDASPDIIHLLDINGIILASNRSYAKRIGLEIDELIGKNVFDFAKTESVQIRKAAFEKVFQTKQPCQLEDIGKTGIFDSHIHPVFNQKGGVMGVAIYARDITKQKQAQQAQQESEKLLSATQQLAKVGGWKWNVESQSVYWTAETYRIHEVDPTKIEPGSTKHIELSLKCYDEKDRSIIHNAFQQCLSEGISYDMEFPFTTAKGNRIWVRTTAAAEKENNKIVSVIGNIMDVTASKKLEIKLLENEKLFKNSEQAAHLGSWEMDMDTGKTKWSDEFFRICGFEPGSIEPSTEAGFKIIHSDDRENAARVVENSIENNTPYAIEKRIIRPDGTTRWVQSIGKVVYYESDKSKKLTGSFLDITERKQTEIKINKAHKQLKELYRHQDEIKENERRAISREIHDELGQLLTALKIDLYYTKDNIEMKADVEKKINGMIDIVSETIKSVQRISSDLRPSLLDDLGLISAIEWYVQEFEKRTNIKCRLELGEIEFADPRKNLAIYRIVQEAFTNIIRHANAENVNVTFYRKDDKVILKIIDDGIGIKTEKISSSASLGLNGIQERAKQFNGSFEISSEQGKGTKLSIVIPFG